MKLGINQAYFFPYLGYFQLINSVDKFIIYELLSYRVQGWMHRNKILDKSSGKSFTISIPVKAKSSNSLIKDVQLAEELDFRLAKLLKGISHNYAKAKHYLEVLAWLQELFNHTKVPDLHTFNALLTVETCKFIGISTEIQIDNTHYQYLEKQLEEGQKEGRCTEADLLRLPRKVRRVIEICRQENATSFINLPGGQKLYSPELFARFNIDLKFTAIPQVRYAQFGDDFVPNLSIIDVLMHCGPSGTMKLVQQTKLI